ncbi:hypothetical protein J3459_021543 [Metarhizium acridum]|nr:hypothetical protein J3459_021543 [Metarhizium acridum]
MENYVDELQEAKLRALGVSFAEEEPPEPSISPPTTNPSNEASVQYPSLPFSPRSPPRQRPSNHGLPVIHFQRNFCQPLQALAYRLAHLRCPFAPGSSTLASQFHYQPGTHPSSLLSHRGWSNPAGILQGFNRTDSPLASLTGILSPRSPYGLEGLQQTASPGF